MSYYHVLTEDETLDRALSGQSIARFGDGELRLALGVTSASQKADADLAASLRYILQAPTNCLTCIPHAKDGPRVVNWNKYLNQPKFAVLFTKPVYGSAFISRPDSAPWINRPDYWMKVRALWEGKDVCLVTGEPEGSNKMAGIGDGARSIRRVAAPLQHAFAEMARIERDIVNTPSQIVILALGATATVLACSLAARGIHAVDIGHIGMFMRRASTTKPEGF